MVRDPGQKKNPPAGHYSAPALTVAFGRIVGFNYERSGAEVASDEATLMAIYGIG